MLQKIRRAARSILIPAIGGIALASTIMGCSIERSYGPEVVYPGSGTGAERYGYAPSARGESSRPYGAWGRSGSLTTGYNTSDDYYNYLGQLGYLPVDGKGTFVNQATGKTLRCGSFRLNLSGKTSITCEGDGIAPFRLQRNPYAPGGEVIMTGPK